jgi:hypothetical protein
LHLRRAAALYRTGRRRSADDGTIRSLCLTIGYSYCLRRISFSSVGYCRGLESRLECPNHAESSLDAIRTKPNRRWSIAATGTGRSRRSGTLDAIHNATESLGNVSSHRLHEDVRKIVEI